MEAFINRNKSTIVLTVVVVIVGFSIYQAVRISNFVVTQFEQQGERVRAHINKTEEELMERMDNAQKRHADFDKEMREYMDMQARTLDDPDSVKGDPLYERTLQDAMERKERSDREYYAQKQARIDAEKARVDAESARQDRDGTVPRVGQGMFAVSPREAN